MNENDYKTKMSLIKGSTNIENIANADIIVEAVFEEMSLKKKCFKELIK